ncbi:MAG: signal peptidase I [Muribaculaceae bacterium]|nr:signal peptidase I [Muribaculaceae bacterium]
MFRKINEICEAYKTKIKEKQAAWWLGFKAKQSIKNQEKLEKLEAGWKKYKESAFCEIVETIVFVVVMVIIIRFYVGEIRWIPSGSMKPTLIEGDRIIVERFSRFFSDPKRGDIMVFYPPSTELSRKPLPLLSRLTGILCKDIAYIKRVVGVPGDKVEIKFEPSGAAFVYINDKKYEEDYIKSVYEYTPCPSEDSLPVYLADGTTISCGPFYLDKDSYFMMGDNRGNSQDSRYWGTLKRDRFVGRAVNVFWPLNRIKILHRLKDTNID